MRKFILSKRKFQVELKIEFERSENNKVKEEELLKTLLSDINVTLQDHGEFSFTENLYDIKINDISFK